MSILEAGPTHTTNMSVRRQTVMLLSLLLLDAGCARLFPAATRNEPRVRSAQPHVERTASRRREGSDVTVPREPAYRWWLESLVPCDATALRPPGDSYCQHIYQRFDSLRGPIDTVGKKRP
jgi:hypothetical protein